METASSRRPYALRPFLLLPVLALLVTDCTGARAEVMDCGSEHTGFGMAHQERNVPSRECLRGAFDMGRPATWRTTSLASDGHPVETRIDVASNGAITVHMDYRQERHPDARGRIARTYRCSTLTIDSFATMPTLRLEGCVGVTGGVLLF